MRVLIAPDKFKGSLSSAEVAAHLAAGLARAGVHTVTLPLADGGDGSVATALAAGFTPLPVTVQDALGKPHASVIAVSADTAIVEVANTCGIAGLRGRSRDAMVASSYGFGQAIRVAIEGPRERLVLALGGSASTDGGVGMLAALGFRFLDRAGRPVTATAGNLSRIHRVDGHSSAGLRDVELVIACDVNSPLLGIDGAAAVFGPQKGADAAQVATLEAGLANIVDAFERSGYSDATAAAQQAGAGAAGGIGFAAMMLGASFVSGATYFLDLLRFDDYAASVDLILTGEGRLDDQSLHGKLPSAVVERAGSKPVIAVVGRNALGSARAAGRFAAVIAVADHCDVDTAGNPQLTARLLQQIGNRIGIRYAAPSAVDHG